MKNQTIKNNSQQLFAFILTIFAVISVFAGASQAAAVHPHLVSGSGNGSSSNPIISADGRYVIFTSQANNLIPGLNDTNMTEDIFIRDLQAGTLRCLSVIPSGLSTGNGISTRPQLSKNGRYVVFQSNAGDLVPGDNNNLDDVFRYDLQTNQLVIVSLNTAGSAPGNNTSVRSQISANGRFVIFASYATDLISGFVDGNGAGGGDFFVRDMQTATTRLITINAAGTASGNGGALSIIGPFPFQIDDSGRYIVFSYDGSNLVAGVTDTNNVPDVFIRDMQNNTTTCLSTTPAGNTTGNGESNYANISADGSRVFFYSLSGNLVPNDNNSVSDIFYRDLTTGTTSLVSANSSGTASGNNISQISAFEPVTITPDGRYVVFNSKATDLVTGYTFTPTISNVFVRDIQTGTTRLVSVNNTGTAAGNLNSFIAAKSAISRDGRYIAFQSSATSLVSEDTNNISDIYVRDMVTNSTTLLSLNQTENNGGNGASSNATVSADTRRVAFESAAGDLAAGDNNNLNDVFYADFGASQKPVSDFDGDGRTDYSVYRPQLNSPWYVFQSSNNLASYRFWGADTDLIAPADYNGDGYTDYGVFRPSNGTWYISDGASFATQEIRFGQSGDKPVPADYDGDGRADVAVFRPSNGVWYILRSSDNQVKFTQFGLANDIPVIGDYDGDNKTDVAVFRPSTGVWHILRSSDGSYFSIQFGLSGDKPTQSDYDGDGKTDIAVYRGGTWYILRSSNNQVQITNWGLNGDIPVAGNYDGDGKTDIAVFRPSDGNWYVLLSSNNTSRFIHFGQSGDIPAPAAFIP